MVGCVTAQTGSSQGWPDNNASSQLIVKTACPFCALQRPFSDNPSLGWPDKNGYGIRSVEKSMPENNRAERAVKPVAIGRKNWMFAGSDGGGKAMPPPSPSSRPPNPAHMGPCPNRRPQDHAPRRTPPLALRCHSGVTVAALLQRGGVNGRAC